MTEGSEETSIYWRRRLYSIQPHWREYKLIEKKEREREYGTERRERENIVQRECKTSNYLTNTNTALYSNTVVGLVKAVFFFFLRSFCSYCFPGIRSQGQSQILDSFILYRLLIMCILWISSKVCILFLGGKKWPSEKVKIILDIRQIFKIPLNGVNIIPVKKNKKRVWYCTTKRGKEPF